MQRTFGLSNTEYEIMEYLWSRKQKASFKEILTYFNEAKEKNWKKQTMGTFLTLLQKEGHLAVDTSGKRYQYYPILTKEEHVTKWMQDFCKDSFSNSIGTMLTAFTGGKKLKKEEADELKDFLDSYGPK